MLKLKSKVVFLFIALIAIIICTFTCVDMYQKLRYENIIKNIVENTDVSFLEVSEQVIEKKYILPSINIEKSEIRTSDLDYKLDIAENLVSNISEGLNTYVYKEEYKVGNSLAHRDITDSIGSDTESKYHKYYRLFGDEAVSYYGHVLYYANDAEAIQNMITIPIQVWSLDENNDWYIKDCKVTVHKALRTTVLCIFNDLLDLPEEERIPIYSIGCYNYREGMSCHSCGAAFDINPDENAEMTISGVITCGRFWRPYENVYSIPADSKMVEIFAKYGYGWGGFWTTKKDYMHFSYFDR